MTQADLIKKIESFAAARGISPATVTSRAAGNSRLYKTLTGGGSCTFPIASRIIDFIEKGRKIEGRGRPMTPAFSLHNCFQKYHSRISYSYEDTQMSLSKVFDPRGFREFFANRWAAFLRLNYRNPEEIAVVYGVRYQTALNWWNAANKPGGDVVAMACLRHGSKFIKHMEG